MEQAILARMGANDHITGATDKARPDGWRKASSAVIASSRLAETGRALGIDKSRAMIAVKRVGAHIGLKAADLLLLDTLAAFSQPQDWDEGRCPIVWPSNAFLMEQTGFSLSTLKRHARRLSETGVITFRDSPNGKRWGRRNAEGVITEAYGFDLSPLSARAEEFEALSAALAEERALCQRLKRQITIARRSIRARLLAARDGGQWGRGMNGFVEAFEALLAGLPGAGASSEVLSALSAKFSGLLLRLDETMVKGTGTPLSDQTKQKMAPKEVISEPHIPTTKKLHSVTCNSLENTEGGADVQDRHRQVGVDVPVILEACPEFASWASTLGSGCRDWRDLVRVAGELRPMIGISEQAWHQAQDQMGKPVAAAALALIFEKLHTGEVSSPGGYLRGMVEKSGAGALHLERSFFGRLRAIAA